MLSSDTPPRNKILVVGRRGAGKLSLVQSILASRFVPTTSVSKSRPSSPLILPAIPVPTLEEAVLDDHVLHGNLHGNLDGTFAPPNEANTLDNQEGGQLSSSLLGQHLQQQQQQLALQQGQQDDTFFGPDHSLDYSITGGGNMPGSQMMTLTRPKQDHSGVTIPWTIDTKYYSVQVDFWIDETEAQGRAELERMIDAGELDEMGAVVEAVLFCFSKNEPSTFHDIKPWLSFVERHEPSITLCVATDAPMTGHNSAVEEDEEYVADYDDWCLGNGFEFINLQDRPENLAQDEHVGLDRILEALAAHMWDGLKRKSSKERDQHERSMMMSFQDDDIDMAYESSSWRDNGSRRSTLGGLENGGLDGLGEGSDHSEDDEDDDKAFYKALAELNLHNRSSSPTAPSHSPMVAKGDSAEKGQGHARMGLDQETNDFDFDSHTLEQLEGDDQEFWSSQGSIRSDRDPIDRTLERQFKQFLGQEVDGFTAGGAEEKSLGLNLDPSDSEYSFELDDDQEFEFGDYVVSTAAEGDDLEAFDFSFAGEMSTPNQESIKTMHNALFSNIDDEDGMAQTIATLQGLREQGKGMSESDRKELAARVALSFGLQMGD